MSEFPYCKCGNLQTVRHIVDSCPWTKFADGIEKLYKVEQETIKWMKSLEFQL
jgi:hypothetical protein